MSNDTPTNGRLPRYTRTTSEVSLALTARDLAILQTVESFRLLTSEHVQALVQGSDQGILRRLHKLFHAGYLDRLAPQRTPNGGSEKMIYAITNKGIRTLQKEGLIQEVSKTDRSAANRDLHDFSIHHRLLVSHIRAIFTLACQRNPNHTSNSWPIQIYAMYLPSCQVSQNSACQANQNQTSGLIPSHSHATFSRGCQVNPNPNPNPKPDPTPSPDLQFLFWREGRELFDTIEVALPQKYAQLPIAPDGFFALQDAKGRLNFFVEADRGSMTLDRFTRKLMAYAAYHKEKGHEAKYGIKRFRVLTVTSSAARCKNLLEAAQAADDVRKDARRFLFAAEKDLPLSVPESVLTKIWTVPGEKQPCSLGVVQKSN